MILLPHHHEFAETLANLPTFLLQATRDSSEHIHFLQRQGNVVPELVTASQLQEYLLDGEADDCVEYIDGYAVTSSDADEAIEEENYFPLWELGDEWLGFL